MFFILNKKSYDSRKKVELLFLSAYSKYLNDLDNLTPGIQNSRKYE